MVRLSRRWFLCTVTMVAMTQSAQASDFKDVRGFGVIHMDYTLTQVQNALSKARVPHQFKVLHKSGDVLITLKTTAESCNSSAGGRWEATVSFGARDRLIRVLIQSPRFLTEKKARAQLAELRRRFGDPVGIPPEGRSGLGRLLDSGWRNTHTVLRTSIASNKMRNQWTVWQSWVPAVAPPTKPLKGPARDGSKINAPLKIR